MTYDERAETNNPQFLATCSVRTTRCAVFTPRRARHFLMSVREIKKKKNNYECARPLQKNWWIGESVCTSLPNIVDLAILLVVVHAIFLTASNLFMMKMMPATS